MKKNKKNPHLRLLITLTFSKIALRLRDAGVAQLVEQLTCNQPVGGSTPLASSISKAKLLILLAIFMSVIHGIKVCSRLMPGVSQDIKITQTKLGM